MGLKTISMTARLPTDNTVDSKAGGSLLSFSLARVKGGAGQ